MVMIDAISRMVPGVLSNGESGTIESFHDNLLEYPQYSRPEVWRDKAVPPVLLSGHHANVKNGGGRSPSNGHWNGGRIFLRTPI